MFNFHGLQHYSLLTMTLKMVYFLVLLIYAQGNVEALRSDNILLVNQGNAVTYPLKVAQTRLYNRTYRPGVEMCRDPSQYQ